VLEDQGSRNGTFLNGQLISGGQALREGDRVRICEIELVFMPMPFPSISAVPS
jgi:phosphoserine phosphatase RsbU/P